MMGVRKFMEMVFTGRPVHGRERWRTAASSTPWSPSTSWRRLTERYALACARTRPTDTVFAQKVFFEIYKQHKGEYLGSIITGVLESTLRQLKADPDSWELDRDRLERGPRPRRSATTTPTTRPSGASAAGPESERE